MFSARNFNVCSTPLRKSRVLNKRSIDRLVNLEHDPNFNGQVQPGGYLQDRVWRESRAKSTATVNAMC